jgi:TetR/AcrR family transcriptional repressor of mexJK operon
MVRQSAIVDRSAVRRDQILGIAAEVFLRDGFSGAAMSDIAERVGGSKATLYNYFPSKKDLFLAVVQDRAERALDLIGPSSGDYADLEAALRDIGLRTLKSVIGADSIAFYRLLISEAGRFPEIGTFFYAEHRRRLVAPLMPHLQRALDAHGLGFEDHLEAGEMFYDLCAGSIHRRALMGVPVASGDAAIAAQVERSVTMFLKLCTKRGAPLAGPRSLV